MRGLFSDLAHAGDPVGIAESCLLRGDAGREAEGTRVHFTLCLRDGRVLEARFQWSHAKDLKPEPEDLPKIEAKIENGLPDDASSSAASADKKKEDGKGG